MDTPDFGTFGSRMRKRAPPSGALSMPISPQILSSMRRATARHIPEPCTRKLEPRFANPNTTLRSGRRSAGAIIIDKNV